MREDAWFESVRTRCAGMLPRDVYARLYQEAFARPDAAILEVGTGRGPGSVCFATGIKDAGGTGHVYAVDQFYQGTSARPHKYTLKKHDNAQEMNVRVFLRNLERFGVEEIVTPVVGKTDTALEKLPARKFGVLFIDVDGMIDRDLALFYNLVALGGRVIIDDVMQDETCLGSLRHGGGSAAEAIRSGDPTGWIRALSPYNRKRAMGKDFITHVLLTHMIDRGLLEKDEVIGKTVFLRKVGPEQVAGAIILENPADRIITSALMELVARVKVGA